MLGREGGRANGEGNQRAVGSRQALDEVVDARRLNECDTRTYDTRDAQSEPGVDVASADGQRTSFSVVVEMVSVRICAKC
jgi:hypothetical protein